MPQLAKLTNDQARLDFLNHAIAAAKADETAGKPLLSSETLQMLANVAGNFDIKLKEFSGSLALRSREIREKNEAVSRLEVYLRDFWESAKRRVFRNNEPAEVLTYYKLPMNGNSPVHIPEKEILTLAMQVIEGDKKAVQAGYPSVASPSAQELDEVLAKARKEFADVAPADHAYNEAQVALAPLRQQADEAYSDVCAELEYKLRKNDPSNRRRIMRTYGVVFSYLPGEQVDEGDTPPPPAAPKA